MGSQTTKRTRKETSRIIESYARELIEAGSLATLAFFAANYVYEIGPLARAHLTMVAFAFAGIYFIDRAFWCAETALCQFRAGF